VSSLGGICTWMPQVMLIRVCGPFWPQDPRAPVDGRLVGDRCDVCDS